MSIIRCLKSAHKFAARVCQVTTVVMETTQLVLSQFKTFYRSQLRIEQRFSLPKIISKCCKSTKLRPINCGVRFFDTQCSSEVQTEAIHGMLLQSLDLPWPMYRYSLRHTRSRPSILLTEQMCHKKYVGAQRWESRGAIYGVIMASEARVRSFSWPAWASRESSWNCRQPTGEKCLGEPAE